MDPVELPKVPSPPVDQFLPENPNGTAKTEAPAKSSVEQVVEDWFRKHFHGLGGSLHEHVYNHVHAAKEELKKLLAAL